MRVLWIFLFLSGLFVTAYAGDAASGRVIKVLPLFLDQSGRVALSPSLFDRDAYQAELREHTNLVSGVRYDVLWTASHAKDAKLTLRVELRGVGGSNLPKLQTLETNVVPGFFHRWTAFTLTGETYHQFNAITAWRATLWDGDRLLGEQKSFLW